MELAKEKSYQVCQGCIRRLVRCRQMAYNAALKVTTYVRLRWGRFSGQ